MFWFWFEDERHVYLGNRIKIVFRPQSRFWFFYLSIKSGRSKIKFDYFWKKVTDTNTGSIARAKNLDFRIPKKTLVYCVTLKSNSEIFFRVIWIFLPTGFDRLLHIKRNWETQLKSQKKTSKHKTWKKPTLDQS
jgi:hypothetical protein